MGIRSADYFLSARFCGNPSNLTHPRSIERDYQGGTARPPRPPSPFPLAVGLGILRQSRLASLATREGTYYTVFVPQLSSAFDLDRLRVGGRASERANASRGVGNRAKVDVGVGGIEHRR